MDTEEFVELEVEYENEEMAQKLKKYEVDDF